LTLDFIAVAHARILALSRKGIGGAHVTLCLNSPHTVQSMKISKITLPILILLLSGILTYLSLTVGHNWGGDFSSYLMQARSIVDGTMDEFVRSNTFTVENSSRDIGPTAYPWGFPTLLAPLYYLYGFNLLAFKIVSILCFELFLLCIFLLFKDRVSFAGNCIILSLFAFNPFLIGFNDSILSDIPFLFFSTLTILLLDRIVLSKRKIISRPLDHVLLGLAAFMAFFIRTNGALLLLVIVSCQVVTHFISDNKNPGNRRANLLVELISGGTFLVLSWVSSMVFPQGGTSHISHFDRLSLAVIAENLAYYGTLPASFFDGVLIFAPAIVYGMTLVFLIAGVCSRIKRDYHFIIYTFLTFALYIIWPAVQGLRFLFPILPFYIYFVYLGIMTINFGLPDHLHAAGRRLSYAACIFVSGSFLIVSVYYAAVNVVNAREVDGPFVARSMDMFNIIKNRTKPDDVIVFFKPRVFSMMTGRNSILIDDPSQLQKGNYLVLHKHMGNYGQLEPKSLINANSSAHLQKIYENDDFSVYKIMQQRSKL